MTVFEDGNPMCSCGGEMKPQCSSFYPGRTTYRCICCGSVVDENGVLHPSEELKREVGDNTITVVIPSIKEKVETIKSIPSFWDFYIEREGNISEARNKGADKVDDGFILFTDDDVSFDYEEVGLIVENLKEKEIAGIKGHSLGMLKGRMMIMRKRDFEEIGAFDEDMTWMEDSDLCIKAENEGYSFKQLPRNLVEHKPHEKRNKSWGGKWHYYLLKKHGFTYLKKFIRAVFRKIGSLL